jgi:uncharacterized membrane protein
MNIILILLRIIHIASGVLWVGGAFFITLFVEPAVKAAGPEGGKMMERLTATRFPTVLTSAAGLAILSGILLYWRDSAGFQVAWITTRTGLTFGLGGIAALAAYGIGVFMVRPRLLRLGAIGKEIAASGGAPSSVQLGEIQTLQSSVERLSRTNAYVMLIILITMSAARYL